MAQETIETIRQAELAAEQAEKAAADEAEQIVAKAHEEAKETIASMTREAREKAAAALDEAGAQGDTMMTEARREVEQDVAKLGESVAVREEQAIKLILSELIGS